MYKNLITDYLKYFKSTIKMDDLKNSRQKKIILSYRSKYTREEDFTIFLRQEGEGKENIVASKNDKINLETEK